MLTQSTRWTRSTHALAASPHHSYTREQLLDALRRDGIVLLEKLETTVEAFENVTSALDEDFVVHPETARDSLGTDGTTQTVTYGTDAVPLHSERAFFPGRPTTLYFMCLKPPASGGETIVCDGSAIIERVSAATKTLIQTRGIRYDYVATVSLWQRMLQTTDEAIARERLASVRQALSADEKFVYEFSDGSLKYTYILPLTNTTRFGDRKAFSNSFFYLAPLRDSGLWPDYLQGGAPKGLTRKDRLVNIALENGDPFPKEAAQEIQNVANSLTTCIEWRAGDLIIIDNTRFLHGRNSFSGDRRILVRTSSAKLDASLPSVPNSAASAGAGQLRRE